MKTYKNILLIVVCCMACSFVAWADEGGVSLSEKTWRSELAVRFDLSGWQGKAGPVVSGLDANQLKIEKWNMKADHNRWINVDGEAVVIRHFANKDFSLTMDVTVAKSCKNAQNAFFNNLARARTLPYTNGKELPYGYVRLDGIGDVCFALPSQDSKGYHTIEFVQNNIVYVLKSRVFSTEKQRVSVDLLEIAKGMDQLVKSQPHYSDWKSSGQWPAVHNLSSSNIKDEKSGLIPLEVITSESKDSSFIKNWEMTAGGIVENNGKIQYYKEGLGPQKLTLMIADKRGLAASASLEFPIGK